MVIIPDTDFILLKNPLELDNRNQLTFSSKTTQHNYFNSLEKLEAEDFTYQRQDEVVRFPALIDDIIEYNYCMYRNNNFSDKWFYAFITDMKYISATVTAISIKTDVYQTWQFDLSFKKSFIEREHVSDDTVGKHTIPENLELGDIISTNLQPTTEANLETCFCVGVSENIITSGYSTLNESLPTGLIYIGATSLQGVHDIVRQYDTAGKGNAIVSVFAIPKVFFSGFFTQTGIDGEISTTVTFTYTSLLTINKTNYIGKNYTPKNKKLMCFPYNFLQVSNHNGVIANYKWEDFNLLNSGSDIQFYLRGTMTPSGSFEVYPVDYKNILNNHDEGIPMGKYPIGGWTNDSYTNWLTQNGVNLGFTRLNAVEAGFVRGAGELAIGAGMALMGNFGGVGIASGGVSDIIGTIGSNYRQSLVPDSAGGNTNCGDYSFAFGLTNFEFKRMSIKNEYAKIIDDYFSAYGYKINEIKLPNLTTRRNWNYIKTIGANIEAYIPQKDLQEIKDMFNVGITLWHNPKTFLDYSQNNNVV